MRLSLRGEHGDEIIQCVVHYCPFIEVVSTSGLNLTDIGVNTLATIKTLKELKLNPQCIVSSSAIQRVLQANISLVEVHLLGAYVDDALVNSIGNYCGN